MIRQVSRRQVLQGAAAATATWSIGWIWTGRAQAAPPKIELLETKVISHQAELYHGWPTVARRRNGQLLLVYSGGREGHICPFGRVEMMRSDDEGQTWGCLAC
jgi:sialidase-1